MGGGYKKLESQKIEKVILITGGCGFIGTNASDFYLKKGYKVIAFDHLFRVGSKENLSQLRKQGGKFVFIRGDTRDEKKLLSVFKEHKPSLILHLAAQVTMVNSVQNPREDFTINVLGSFNVLEAMRKITPEAQAIYSSTNKVYGDMSNVPITEEERRYNYQNTKGISENYPLDFHGPYGCSKGAADQYFLDYARIYNLTTTVFRQSGIYGSYQFGIEEQGWLAWFCNALLFDKPVTIYGDGKQVRDVLYITDLLKAYDLIFENPDKARGRAYNIGGGPDFSLSIWELFDILESLSRKKMVYSFDAWRPGDQKIYVSDISRVKKDLGWQPEISPQDGVKNLYNWIFENKSLVEKAGVFKK
jgi:CDP-paratose 2-epimerase